MSKNQELLNWENSPLKFFVQTLFVVAKKFCLLGLLAKILKQRTLSVLAEVLPLVLHVHVPILSKHEASKETAS